MNRQYIEQIPIPLMNEYESDLVGKLASLLTESRKVFPHAEGSRDPGERIRWKLWEDLLDALSYQLFFPDEISEARVDVFDTLRSSNLGDICQVPESRRRGVIIEAYSRLSDEAGPVQSMLSKVSRTGIVAMIRAAAAS